ncbi:hypothetical protein [Shewanella algae]|uniref:hypothetical protein n=1 Tax=Shewanella algae TaxID=38313 RepID=UPI0034D4B8EA
MIITQQIINGVCSVTKTGSYFNLISAGGVVRVKLTKNGSTVLDSKMWVGMNLDKAQPFDEVEIYGADGPIEFWAGDVSMTLFRLGSAGAAAVRTSVKYVSGVTQLTGADVGRSELWVRPSIPMSVGGASISGDGWIVQAGEVLKLPLAGTVFGETERAQILLGSGEEAEAQNAYPAGTNAVGTLSAVYGELMINFADKSKRVSVGNGGVLYCDGATWIEHPDFPNSSNSPTTSSYRGIQHPDGTMFVLRKTVVDNTHYLYESTDGGLSFQRKLIITHPQVNNMINIGAGAYSAIGIPQIVGTQITINYVSHAIIWDYVKNTWDAVKHPDTATNRYFVALDSKTYIRSEKQPDLTYHMQKSDDAGENWRTVCTINHVFDYTAVSFDGRNILLKAFSANKPLISKDAGETFIEYPVNIARQRKAVFISGDVEAWLVMEIGTIKWIDVTDLDNINSGTEINLPNQTNSLDFSIDNSGQLYALMDGYSYSQKMAIAGNLAPGRVEVMELLA